MGLSGSLRTLSLAEIFHTLNRSAATGVLRLSGQEGGRDVVFDDGEITTIVTHAGNRQHTIVERLVGIGLLGREHLMQPMGTGSGGFSAVEQLIELGVFSRPGVQEALTEQLHDEIYELFTWTSANFQFREAGPNDQEAARLVEEARRFPLQTSVSVLLMEAARRLDEWREIADFLPNSNDIPEVLPERRDELLQLSEHYPCRAVGPMINGYRCLEEIYDQTPAPRMLTQFCLYDLMNEGLVKILSLDEIEERGQQMLAQGRQDLAVQLFRRLVAMDRSRTPVVELLAECLEELGGGPEATGCYAQLAMTYLEEGRGHEAVTMAAKAVEIEPEQAQVMLLVRCLLDVGAEERAVEELMRLCHRLIELGHLDEARTTCQKVLGIDPDCGEARRELARIYQLLGGLGIDDQVIVCVQCGQTNDREREACQSCGAALHLTCLACGRVVAASDSLCIFCGCDPHAEVGTTTRLKTQAPKTDVIFAARDRERSSNARVDTEDWRAGVAGDVRRARELEEQDRLQESLEVWKQLSHDQVDLPQLDVHIRDLESVIHDREVQRLIERGHSCRRQRKYWSAHRAYRQARRCVADDDPRTARLEELEAEVKRGHRISSLAYSLAGLCLLASAWIGIEPQFARARFVEEVDPVIERVGSAVQSADLAAWSELRELPVQWRTRAESEGIDEHFKIEARLNLLESQVRTAGSIIKQAALQDMDQALESGDWRQAQQQAAQYRLLFPDAVGQESFSALIERIESFQSTSQELASLRQQAPQQLAEAQAKLEAGSLQAALEQFATLAAHKDLAEIEQQASVRLAELRQRQARYQEAVAANAALRQSDLPQALRGWQALADEAKAWDDGSSWTTALVTMQQDLQRAEKDWARLDASGEAATGDLQNFIAAHPGTPEAETAQRRIDEHEQALAIRSSQIAEGIADYRTARQAKDIARAYTVASRLYSRFPRAAADADVELPTIVECGRPAVAVRFDDRDLGKTDDSGRLTWWHAHPVRGALQLALDGFDPVRIGIDGDVGQAVLTVALQRAALWEQQVEAGIGGLARRGEDLLVSQAGHLLCLRPDNGEQRWRLDLGEADLLATGTYDSANLSSTIAEGGLLVPTPTGQLLLVDGAGRQQHRLDVDMQILDRPQRFRSPILNRHRIAVTGAGLAIGDTKDDWKRSKEQDIIAGPFVLQDAIDTLLVVGDVDGRLTAYTASDLQAQWSHSLRQVINMAPFERVADDAFITLLNGSVLVRCQIRGDGVGETWRHEIRGELLGRSLANAACLAYATPSTIRVLGSANKRIEQELAFDGQRERPTAALGCDAQGVAYGLAVGDGYELRYRPRSQTALGWRRELPAVARALVLTEQMVVVGCKDGRVVAVRR